MAGGISQVAEQLLAVPLFSSCSKRELQTIAKATKEVHHKAGATIAREGDAGIGLFVITDGTAKVTIGGKTKARLGPGDFFGEIALIDGGPRTASVEAETPLTVLGLTEWVFRGMLQQHPTIALKTLQSLAGRLRSATKTATD
jgi:CRP/FNR family cyclic AMP-dependent transcriptional regulator